MTRALLVPLAWLAACAPSLEIRTDFRIEYGPRRTALAKAYAEAHYGERYRARFGSPEFPGLEIEPEAIVVHYTAGSTLQGAFATFAPETLRGRPYLDAAGALNVGVQFVVDRDGTVHQTMPANRFARHCIGLNHCAIGIENVARGDITAAALAGRLPAPDTLTLAQLDANVALIRHLKREHPAIRVLIGHHEYRDLEDPAHPAHDLFCERDPDYRTVKRDPGPRFMRALRARLADLLDLNHEQVLRR